MPIHAKQPGTRNGGGSKELPRFTVGRDHHGWWVVDDRLGRVGGIFTDESAAMRYALEESNRDRRAVRRQPQDISVEFRLVH